MSRSEVCNVVGLGAGGHARSLLEAIRLQWGTRVRIVGLTDNDPRRRGEEWMGVVVVGSDEELPKLCRSGVSHFFLGVGGTGDNGPRRALYQQARQLGLIPLTIQHPGAVVAASAVCAPGTVVLACAVVGPGVHTGENVIINTAAVVEHDCRVGSHAHLASGCVLGGGVMVEEGAHVGLGACVRQGIHIGAEALVGVGAVVVKDLPPGCVAVGNPARPRPRVDRPDPVPNLLPSHGDD
jgi:UDP-perosamine 4-acetyltransferase